MKIIRQLFMKLKIASITLVVSLHISGCAAFANTTGWKEEVLLHDGQQIIVERSQEHDWKIPHELTTRSAPTSEEKLTLLIPGSDRKVVWGTSYDDSKPEGTSLTLLMLDVMDGTPYLATYPAGCISYNKWGRPNPPYVFFKYDGKTWQRIPLEEFPVELQKTNVMVGNYQAKYFTAEERDAPFLTVETVNKANRDLRHTPFLLAVTREPIKSGIGSGEWCGELIRVKDGWEGTGFFSGQPSKEACLKYCEREEVSAQNCPCNRFFKGAK